MVSTSTWVPLATAALGLVTGLGTAFFTQLRADSREKLRWEREGQDRLEQWERERQDRLEQWQREDSQRWLQERQQAYARFITTLYEWESALDKLYMALWRDRKEQTRTEFDMTAIKSAGRAASEALVSVRFIAPKSLRDKAQFVFSVHNRFRLVTADVTSGDQLAAQWEQVRNSTEGLHELMGKDLGLETPPEGEAPSGQ